MQSALHGMIEKAHRYSEEPERVLKPHLPANAAPFPGIGG